MVDDLLAFIHNSITRHIVRMSQPEVTTDSDILIPVARTMDEQMKAANVTSPSIVLNVEQFIHDVESRPAIWNRNYHCNKLFMEQTWDELSAIHKLSKQTLKTKWKGLRDNFRVEYKRIPRNENGEFLIPPENHDSKWTHYQSLLFLVEHMRHRQPKSETDAYYYHNPIIDNGEECEQTLVEPDLPSLKYIQLPDINEDDNQLPVENGKCRRWRSIQPPECSSNDSAMFSNGTSGGALSSRTSSNGYVPAITIKRKRSLDDSEDGKFCMEQVIDPDDDYHYLLSLHPYMKQLVPAQKLRLRTKIQKLIFRELYKEELEESK